VWEKAGRISGNARIAHRSVARTICFRINDSPVAVLVSSPVDEASISWSETSAYVHGNTIALPR